MRIMCILVSIRHRCILATILEYLAGLHQFHLKFDHILSQGVTIGCIKTNSMNTIPGNLNAILAFGLAEVLPDLSLVGLCEVFAMIFFHYLETFPARFVKESLLLGMKSTCHRCISCNDTQRFVGYLPFSHST